MTTPEHIAENIVAVTVSGPVGSGKSAVLGEIEIALKAIGLPVEHDAAFRAEKNMTHADWQHALDMYKPRVFLSEAIDHPVRDPDSVMKNHGERWLGWNADLGHFVTEWFDGLGWVFSWNQEPSQPTLVMRLPDMGKRL